MAGGAAADADTARANADTANFASFDAGLKTSENFTRKQEQSAIDSAVRGIMQQKYPGAQPPGAPQPAQQAPAEMQPPSGPPPAGAYTVPVTDTGPGPEQAQQVQVANQGGAMPPVGTPPAVPQTAALVPTPAVPNPVAPAMPAAPPTAVAQAAQAQALPATTAQAAPGGPQALPATYAMPATSVPVGVQLRQNAVMNGKINILSDDVVNNRISAIQKLATDGTIRQSTADAQITALTGARNKQIADAQKIQENFADIDKKQADADKARVEKAALVRKATDNYVDDVMQAYNSGDLVMAQQLAREYGLAGQIDFQDPNSLQQAVRMSRRSEQYKERQTENRAQAGEARAGVKAEEETAKASREAALGNTSNLPEGFRTVVVAGKPVVLTADGKVATQAQIQAASERKSAAGATRVNVGTSSVTGEPIPQGAVRLVDIKAGAQIEAGNQIEGARAINSIAGQMQSLIPSLEAKVGAYQRLPQFVGKSYDFIQRELANDPDFVRYNQLKTQLVNEDLRLNKGAQTEGDAQRSEKALGNAGVPFSVQKQTVDEILNRTGRMAKNAQSIQRGYIMPGENAPLTPGATNPGGQGAAPPPTLPKVGADGAGYDKLPSGSRYIGPDGKTYMKR